MISVTAVTPKTVVARHIYCTEVNRHNPGVSLPLIISGHGFCGHPWLSRSEGGHFSFSAREALTLVLGF